MIIMLYQYNDTQLLILSLEKATATQERSRGIAAVKGMEQENLTYGSCTISCHSSNSKIKEYFSCVDTNSNSNIVISGVERFQYTYHKIPAAQEIVSVHHRTAGTTSFNLIFLCATFSILEYILHKLRRTVFIKT